LIKSVKQLHIVTLKCESEEQTVSLQENMHLDIQMLESQCKSASF